MTDTATRGLDPAGPAESGWSEDALWLLARAGRVLGASLDIDETLDAFLELLVPAVADAVVLRVGDLPSGSVLAESIRAVPEMDAAVRDYVRAFPPTNPAGSALARAASTRAAVVSNAVTDQWCRDLARSEAQYQGLLSMGIGAVVAVPLLLGDRSFGAMSLMMSRTTRRTFPEGTALLVEELARRAAVAADHARLFAAERAARARVELLQALSGKLAEATSPEAIAAIALDEGRRALGASMGLVALPSADGSRLDALDMVGYEDGVMDVWRTIPLDPAVPVADAFLRREPVWLHDAAERARLYPSFSPFHARAGYVAGASIPLVAGGRALGVIALAFADAHTFDPLERTLMLSVAQQCAIALARADAMRSLQRWADVFEHTTQALAVLDADATSIVAANPAWERLFGYTQGELEGMALSRLEAPPRREEIAANVARVAATEHAFFETRYRRRDGSEFAATVDATLVSDPAGKPLYRVVNVADLTERYRFEAELRQSQKMEAIGRLAGGVAHEINNALQGVLGFTAFALKSLTPDHAAWNDVEQAARSGERARDIAWQLLAFSRRQILQPQPLELTGVVNDFLPVLRQGVGPDRELLHRSTAAAPVAADRGQLEQVLLNLILNARDATRPGGLIEILVDVLPVTPALLAADAELRAGQVLPGRYARLRVRDDGEGMDHETRSRVFEPFFTTKTAGDGTGLGLAVAHGIVEQSGGRIWCESSPGAGTTFTVLLPSRELDETGNAHARRSGDSRVRGAERVLVVDDEAHVRGFLRRELEALGYAVRESVDGVAALAWLEDAAQNGTRPIELVITDLIMPRLSGREFGAAVVSRWPDVGLLYMSGYPGDEVIRQGMLSAEDAFMQKPFAGEELAARVRTLLDGAAAR